MMRAGSLKGDMNRRGEGVVALHTRLLEAVVSAKGGRGFCLLSFLAGI